MGAIYIYRWGLFYFRNATTPITSWQPRGDFFRLPWKCSSLCLMALAAPVPSSLRPSERKKNPAVPRGSGPETDWRWVSVSFQGRGSGDVFLRCLLVQTQLVSPLNCALSTLASVFHVCFHLLECSFSPLLFDCRAKPSVELLISELSLSEDWKPRALLAYIRQAKIWN